MKFAILDLENDEERHRWPESYKGSAVIVEKPERQRCWGFSVSRVGERSTSRALPKFESYATSENSRKIRQNWQFAYDRFHGISRLVKLAVMAETDA